VSTVTTSPTLVVMVGAPGSGKSTLVGQLSVPAHQVVSLERYRLELADDVGCQEVNPIAAQLYEIRLRERIRRRLDTVVDATNGPFEHRAEPAALARVHEMAVVAVMMQTPVETCLARQVARLDATPEAPNGSAVPDEFVREVHEAIEAAVDLGPHRRAGSLYDVIVHWSGGSGVSHGPVPPGLFGGRFAGLFRRTEPCEEC